MNETFPESPQVTTAAPARDCPFCGRVDRGEYDDGDRWAVTFEPRNPVTPGHRLFVPRAHVTDALADPVAAGKVMECAAAWAAASGTGPCNLITSAGREATQSVFHYHLHLVPRAAGDGLHLPWTGQQAREAAVLNLPADLPAIAVCQVRHGVPDDASAAYWAACAESERRQFRAMASAALTAAGRTWPLTFTPVGYQGPAQHTYTTACDGFHEPGQCPRAEQTGGCQ